ncbi:MAG: DUF6290 family protein [Finegoldia magna]|uniref:type II toxin-antitoxin system RelB family antitoxin n=1 Tax=Finegoldia magna TaxID=1260 RepID=UPI002911C25E|nr:DUF6290 family protein [Finegoldia magna]MDU5960472.1 DUF6290 family protein [Finegoldia magna]
MKTNIQLTQEEMILAKNYAKNHSMNLEDAFKNALFEKIEDEYDTILAKKAYEDYLKDEKNSKPISELWKSLDL